MKKATTAMKKSKSGVREGKAGASPSQLIDARIRNSVTGAAKRSRECEFIKKADPEVVETWKWRGVPVWEHAGIICTGETRLS